MAAQHRRNGNSRGTEEQEMFKNFFERWLGEQDRYLQDLLTAAAPPSAESTTGHEEEERRVRMLVDRVIVHYENYYRTKSASAKRDVRPMFSPTWTSSTEKLFLWVGGWRPSTAFHLLYSKSGLQVESQLDNLIRGVATGDLADLSPDQLERIDRLQRQTVQLEKVISEEEASIQETVANSDLVDLSHRITSGEWELEAMEREMKGKREAMERVLERADRLRLDTLKGVVAILRPMQAVHFLIAGAELHLRVHEFGKTKDESTPG